MDLPILSVGDLTRRIKELLEEEIARVWVEGEISGWKRHQSGHAYFTLKDERAVVRAVIWASTLARMRLQPANGQRVRVLGRISVYEARGEYQLYVDRVVPAGEGDLQAAFLELKARLEAEGLFDPRRKRRLPRFPRRIGIVTSPTGAALRDFVRILRRRWPVSRVYLWPAAVQGVEATGALVEGIEEMDRLGFDLLVVGRGGGSLEDLWAFNEEAVARALADCRTPVVSAVGHEIDFTIADFVADVRAATPSHAAELVAPDRDELLRFLQREGRALAQGAKHRLERAGRRLDRVRLRPTLVDPGVLLRDRRLSIDRLDERLLAAQRARLQETHRRVQATRERLRRFEPDRRLAAFRTTLAVLERRLRGITGTLENRRSRVELAGARLRALGPRAVLARGYGIVRSERGAIVRGAEEVAVGTRVEVVLHRGSLECSVEGRTLAAEDLS
ncbi:MAG: exodeoxyribonuclease VII large subunit [Candidatus Eisenbacteria bacterium]